MTASQLEIGGMIAAGVAGGGAVSQIVTGASASPIVVLMLALNCGVLMYLCRLRRVQAERAQQVLDQILQARTEYLPVSLGHTFQPGDRKSVMYENRSH